MLSHWPLDPEVTYLNHGTVGVTPKRVLAAQQRIRDEIERQPSRYMLRELVHIPKVQECEHPKMRAAAEVVAHFMGAKGDDLVFVDNTTTGINAILRSLEFREGDEIVILDHAYGAIANAAAYVARRSGARVKTATLPYPAYDPNAFLDAITNALTPRTRLAIIDHITSESALILPIKEIARSCREHGVPILADGAHAPGALPLDIPDLGVDWYVGNLHKWAFAPRSCGFIWAKPEHQKSLHPAVISWGLDKGFAAEFDWIGTRDPSPFLAAVDGVAFMRELGVEAMQKYNHSLAWTAAQKLTDRWGTKLGMSEAMVGTMSTFPLPEKLGTTKEEAYHLRKSLLNEDKIEVQLHSWRNRLWVRISAQVYNDESDLDRLSDAVVARLK